MSKRKPAKAQEKPDPNALTLPAKPDQTAAEAMAIGVLRPTVTGAQTAKAYGRKYGDHLELNALVMALSDQAKAVQGGDLGRPEAMLIVQAHTLDAIFNELAQRAAMNMGQHLGAFEAYMRLALKAQSQSRTTVETLAAIKNPAPVAFVRQANIAAGPQQVNNGIFGTIRAGARASAREVASEQSKLTGAGNELRADGGSSVLARGADPQMEALGEIDGAENGGR
jgi:hypothetical protein